MKLIDYLIKKEFSNNTVYKNVTDGIFIYRAAKEDVLDLGTIQMAWLLFQSHGGTVEQACALLGTTYPDEKTIRFEIPEPKALETSGHKIECFEYVNGVGQVFKCATVCCGRCMGQDK